MSSVLIRTSKWSNTEFSLHVERWYISDGLRRDPECDGIRFSLIPATMKCLTSHTGYWDTKVDELSPLWQSWNCDTLFSDCPQRWSADCCRLSICVAQVVALILLNQLTMHMQNLNNYTLWLKALKKEQEWNFVFYK